MTTSPPPAPTPSPTSGPAPHSAASPLSNGGSGPAADRAAPSLPAWAADLVTQYESGAASQFILHGNVTDTMVLPLVGGDQLGSLTDFVLRVLLPRFDVVLSFDLGNGLRVEKGSELFSQWPTAKQKPEQVATREPRTAVETITQYLRYCANVAKLGGKRTHVGVFLRSASLIAPSIRGTFNYDLAALAMHVRDWGTDPVLTANPFASFLVTENISDLHELLVNNPRASRVLVPLPPVDELARAFRVLAPRFATALEPYQDDPARPAPALAGATLHAVESMLKTKQHTREALRAQDLAELKKELVERDTRGLIDFIQTDRSLDDLHGMEAVKDWLRQDIELWRQDDLAAMPMGYLVCGPVGTGKTYLVECLAGDAGVPVVKLKNFRDRWVGSTEGNLETIFRLLHALGRCIVFIDEADQALGRRSAESSDSGVGGRVYSMMAEEMSNTRNRGRIVWVLASSRPDLIEVDLKRPGRVDVKIPLFPTSTAEEGFGLIRALCKKRGLEIETSALEELRPTIPQWLTPGAAEALSVKLYRRVKTAKVSPLEALKDALADYRHPVAPDVMKFQIELALREASDINFVPASFRG